MRLEMGNAPEAGGPRQEVPASPPSAAAADLYVRPAAYLFAAPSLAPLTTVHAHAIATTADFNLRDAKTSQEWPLTISGELIAVSPTTAPASHRTTHR